MSESNAGDDDDRGAPEHLVPLPGGPFGLWPWACVRAAGFPARRVLDLAAPRTAAAIDALLGEDSAGGRAPGAELLAAYEEDAARIGEVIRAAALDARLREAIAWQNRRALHTGLDVLARRPPGARRNKDVRQKEALIASYLQRYCVKNDTIGFFGPVCWSRIDGGAEALRLTPGPGLIEARAVRFEAWCIDALAQKLTGDPELRPWAAPRLLPYFRVEGTALHVPFSGAIDLAPAQAAILRAADGTRSARALARELLADASLGLEGEADVLGMLERAAEMGVVAWSFEVPMQLHPEQALRRALEGVEDEGPRARALSALDALDGARAGVAAAAGDAGALDEAMERLEQTFEQLTAVPATRAAGRVYAARTLVYEDCRRDMDISFGAPLLARLGPPLSMLLLGARWATFEVGRRYAELLDSIFDTLAAQRGGAPVELIELHKALVDREPWLIERRGLPRVVREVQDELRARWARILRLPPGARTVARSVEELRSSVSRELSAPGPGWGSARHVSPDIMIAARDADAVRAGACTFVLGEIHVSNSLLSSLFTAQHPSVEELVSLMQRDLPDPSVLPVMPKDDYCQRVNQDLAAAHDLYYAFGQDPSPGPPSRTLRAADLVVAREGGALEVRSRDGGARLPLMELMGALLSIMAANVFDVLPEEEHTPRVSLGDLVIARERWRFDAAGAAFASAPDPPARWIATRAFQRRHGLPRFVFLKTPVEAKPCYIDLDSPVYVEIMAKLVRRAAESAPGARISLTEMLPTFDDLWLPDAAGERYTAELRLVAFDPA